MVANLRAMFPHLYLNITCVLIEGNPCVLTTRMWLSSAERWMSEMADTLASLHQYTL